MKPKWRDLLETPGTQASGVLSPMLLAIPLVGYQLFGSHGGFVGVAISLGCLLAVPLTWLFYHLSWRRYCLWWSRFEALCPYCDCPYEGRQAVGNGVKEVPPIRYVWRRRPPRRSLGQGSHSGLAGQDRQVRCFRPDCHSSKDTLGCEQVPGTIVLLIVKQLRQRPGLGSAVPVSKRAEAILSKQVLTGSRGAALTYQAVDRYFAAPMFPLPAQQRLSLVWVEEGVNPLAVENLRTLERQPDELLFEGRPPFDLPDAESGISAEVLGRRIHSFCG